MGKFLRACLDSRDEQAQAQITPIHAASLILDRALSVCTYKEIGSSVNDAAGRQIFPPYYQVLEAKKDCRPDEVSYGEDDVVVPMQKLLEHTAEQIFEDEDLKKNVAIFSAQEEVEATMFYKIGTDGSSGFTK